VSFGKSIPGFGKRRGSFGESIPGFGKGRVSFGKSVPGFGKRRRGHGGPIPGSGERRASLERLIGFEHLEESTDGLRFSRPKVTRLSSSPQRARMKRHEASTTAPFAHVCSLS
jgi:hypothetical protein